jgi:hypothetical protein
MHEKIILTKAILNKIAIARLYKSDATGLDMIRRLKPLLQKQSVLGRLKNNGGGKPGFGISLTFAFAGFPALPLKSVLTYFCHYRLCHNPNSNPLAHFRLFPHR